jgi:hypothetical protein
MFENGHALQRLANGEDIDKVLEDMARRITEKLIHPIIKEIDKMVVDDYDPVASKKRYEENYLQKFGPKPDHILDEKIDKPE